MAVKNTVASNQSFEIANFDTFLPTALYLTISCWMRATEGIGAESFPINLVKSDLGTVWYNAWAGIVVHNIQVWPFTSVTEVHGGIPDIFDWTHFLFEVNFEFGTMDLYIDGVLKTPFEEGVPTGDFLGADILKIFGGDWPNLEIAELAVFDTVFSETIRNQLAAGLSPANLVDNSCIGCWRLLSTESAPYPDYSEIDAPGAKTPLPLLGASVDDPPGIIGPPEPEEPATPATPAQPTYPQSSYNFMGRTITTRIPTIVETPFGATVINHGRSDLSQTNGTIENYDDSEIDHQVYEATKTSRGETIRRTTQFNQDTPIVENNRVVSEQKETRTSRGARVTASSKPYTITKTSRGATVDNRRN